ncbi:stress response small protein YobI, partial [Escherichia coli]|nr:stress response small protein YobI [Escherichia coli]EIH0024441.1 stress response small protein YobI [Escherichia coli]EJU9656694.1 stress response small protein YobI [Escherichia coli]EKG8038065.1 stress response small protein YobI [Escherichia coli]EKQ0829311.1 stress response small protein YobI [Escherichia coli]
MYIFITHFFTEYVI